MICRHHLCASVVAITCEPVCVSVCLCVSAHVICRHMSSYACMRSLVEISDAENRTGAKLVVRESTAQAAGPRKDTQGERGEETGSMTQEAGTQAQDTQEQGMLRTKPGRGETTRSMSCSDKIARWNVCAPNAAASLTELMRGV